MSNIFSSPEKPLPRLPERTITLVYGKTGFGKTQWTRRALRRLKRVIIMDPLDEYDGLLCIDPGALLEWGERYQTFQLRTNAIDRFEDVCLTASVLGRTTLVVEESQRILPPKIALPPAFEDIVYRGRHSATSLILVSQRPSTVNIVARSQWTRIISFCQTEHIDTQWLRGTSGYDLSELTHLTRFQYYDILPSGVEEKVLDPLTWNRREKVR